MTLRPNLASRDYSNTILSILRVDPLRGRADLLHNTPIPATARTPSSSRRTRRCAAGGWSAARGVSRRAARQARAARAAHLRQQRPHRQDLDLGRVLPHLFLRGRRRRVRTGAHADTRATRAAGGHARTRSGIVFATTTSTKDCARTPRFSARVMEEPSRRFAFAPSLRCGRPPAS